MGKIKLGEKIKQKIKESGLSKATVARRLGRHPATIYRKFDKSGINTEQLIELSRAVGYNFLWDLLFDDRLLSLREPVDIAKYIERGDLGLLMEPEAAYNSAKDELKKCKDENEALTKELVATHKRLLQEVDKNSKLSNEKSELEKKYSQIKKFKNGKNTVY